MIIDPTQASLRRPAAPLCRPGDIFADDRAQAASRRELAVAVVFSIVLQRIYSVDTEVDVRREVEMGLRRLAELGLAPGHRDDMLRLLVEHCDQKLGGLQTARSDSSGRVSNGRLPTMHGHGGCELSEREREVLEWIAQGKRDCEIATILGISSRTVGKHVENLLRKLQAESRTAAVAALLGR